MHAERAVGPGANASIGSVSVVLWGSWANARLVTSNQKNKVSEAQQGSYIRGVPEEVLGGRGTTDHQDFWEVTAGSDICMGSCRCHPGWWLVSAEGPRRPLGQRKLVLRQQHQGEM